MADLPILYSFRRCPYAMRARMALLVSGTVCEIREIALGAKPEAMIAVSPKATVPVLLADGVVIDESLDIMRWALARADPEGWLEGDDATLIATNDGAFKFHLDRYKYPDRHGSDPAEHRAAGLEILGALETRLGAHANLCGDARGLADIAIMPFVRQFARTDPAWFDAQPLSRVQQWLARHLASPLFAAAMAKHARWQPGDAPTLLA
jgi:glutathione S-transferase